MTKNRKKLLNLAIPVDVIDALLKSGKDPLELMNEMKKAIMERDLNAEIDYRIDSDEDNSRNGYGSKTANTDNGSVILPLLEMKLLL